MDKDSVPRTSRFVAFAVILGGRVVDGWIDPEWAGKEQAMSESKLTWNDGYRAYGDAEVVPGHTCKTCGGPLAAPGRDGEGLVKGLSTCRRCGAVHRFDFYSLRRWPNDTGTAYEAHLQTPGKEVTA
jgi:hypothetical protein